MATLKERAAQDPEIVAILQDQTIRHSEAAKTLGTSEASIRRWRTSTDWTPDYPPPEDLMWGARILTLDIETAPHLAYVWGLWEQNVQPTSGQLRESGTVIAFAGKWYGEPKVEFYSDHHDGHATMVEQAHRMLSEADIVVHYNGTEFDMKHLHREFVLAGMTPPAPVREVDLLRVVRSRFKFPSNKLDYVTRELGIGQKVSHTGFQLWVDCMAGDEKAWALMRKYNIGDVRLTEALYDRLRPWITGHPHLGLYSGEEMACDKCGSTDLIRDGRTATPVTQYTRFKCSNCGGWSRTNHREARVLMRGVK